MEPWMTRFKILFRFRKWRFIGSLENFAQVDYYTFILGSIAIFLNADGLDASFAKRRILREFADLERIIPASLAFFAVCFLYGNE